MENWKDIPGYDGLYKINDKGIVVSFKRKNSIIRKSTKSTSGYCQLSLCKNNRIRMFSLHRLVAEIFIPNPNNLPEVNHIDGDKANNNIENLEWVTRSENEYHAYKSGLKKAIGKKPVSQFSKEEKYIRSFESVADASKFIGISQTSIFDCLSGRRKTAKDYIWKEN